MKSKESHEFLPHPRPYYPWLILLISLVFQYYKQLLLISPSVMVPQLAQKYHFDTDKLGLLIGMAMYSFFIFQIPIGILIDKWGVRRITSLGILISAAGIILFGFAPTQTHAFIGRFLIGLGSSVALVNIVKIVANWFHPKMFALLIGVAISIGAIGDVSGIYLTKALVNAFGIQIAMLNFGLIGVIFAIIFFLVVRDDVPGAQYDINPKVQRLKLSSTIMRMLKRKQSWIIALFAGFAQTLFPVFLGLWGIPYLMARYKYTEEQSMAVHAAFFVGLIITAPLIGYISTAVKKRKIFIVISTLFATLLSIGIVHFNSPPFSFYMLMFFLQGVSFGIFPLCIAIMREQNVSKISATSFAFLNSTYAIFAAISEQATGLLFDFQWKNTLFKGIVNVSSDAFYMILFRATFWLTLAFIFSLFIKDTYAKQKIKEDLPVESRK